MRWFGKPRRYTADNVSWVLANYDLCPKILTLIQDNFAYMNDRVDPPSSMHSLTVASVVKQMENEILLAIIENKIPVACAFVTELDDAFYIGKLAATENKRGRGAGAALIEWVENLSRESGIAKPLRLETRIELTENHALFARLGFVKTEETAHPGYVHPTSITMEKQV